MKSTAIVTIGILAIVVTTICAALYLSIGGETPLGQPPYGSFIHVDVENNRTINLAFEKDGGDAALYEDCRLSIADPQDTQYIWNLTEIIWMNNEAKSDQLIPGIELRIIRSNGQTAFSTGDLIELEKLSGTLVEGNWTVTLIFRPTGGAIASRTIAI